MNYMYKSGLTVPFTTLPIVNVITIPYCMTGVCELVEASSTGICGRACTFTSRVPVVESIDELEK